MEERIRAGIINPIPPVLWLLLGFFFLAKCPTAPSFTN